MTPDEGRAFFEAYLRAWNAQDLEALSALFAEPSLFVLPQASLPLADRSATQALLKQVFDGLNADNFEKSRYAGVTARSCGDGLAILDATTVDRLRKDGSVIESIDAHYVLRRETDGAWRIVTVVVCAPGWRDPL